jgi:hypothetical protein
MAAVDLACSLGALSPERAQAIQELVVVAVDFAVVPRACYFHVSGCSAFQRIAVKMRVRPLG